jgi:hypothetical protein
MYNQERAASVRAKEPTWLWTLDRFTFQHVVRDYNIERKKKFYDILSSIPLCEASPRPQVMWGILCLSRFRGIE